jgi:hypothetical protein
VKFVTGEQTAKKFQAGDARNVLSGQKSPEQHHEGAVGDGEVALLDRFTIGRVGRQVGKGWRSWNDNKMALGAKLQEFRHVTHEKVNAQNTLKFLSHAQL